MSNNTLEMGALGWQHPAWDDSYYPEDLPEDWRLDYYSHHFQVLLMPCNDWNNVCADDVEQWLSDIKQGFVFFFVIDQVPDQQAIQQLQMIHSILAERMAGLVWQGDSDSLRSVDIDALPGLVPFFVDSDARSNDERIQPCWRPGRDVVSSTLGFISQQQAADTRAMRQLIEDFLQQADDEVDLYLIFEGQPPSIKAMQDAQIIEQMLASH